MPIKIKILWNIIPNRTNGIAQLHCRVRQTEAILTRNTKFPRRDFKCFSKVLHVNVLKLFILFVTSIDNFNEVAWLFCNKNSKVSLSRYSVKIRITNVHHYDYLHKMSIFLSYNSTDYGDNLQKLRSQVIPCQASR